MKIYTETFKTIWANFDPNLHMRHTAYNDYAAEVRARFFKAHGFDLKAFSENNLGPILFKEETSFLREIQLGDDITIDLQLEAVSKGGERWKLKHNIYDKNGKLAAEIKIYGAWLDLKLRKLTSPPSEMVVILNGLVKTESFEEIILTSK
ncbi:MAG: thioesterase family protein [Flavobacteriaceae bacterium]|nr:thioesterase family protein [Flavobacteriaceae bacterium]